MDYQETKQKVLKLCDNLNKEGLLTEAELENCRRSFTFEGQDIDLELYKFAKTSKEFSFGMNDNQGVDVLYADLTKNKIIKCFLASGDKKMYLSIRPGIPNELYMAPNEITEDTQSYILFVIELQNIGKYAGTYTLMNAGTGNYIEVNQDKTISANSNVINDNCYFKLAQSGPSQFLYTFESAKYPGRYLIADNPVAISNNGPKYWAIERISPDTEIITDGALKKDEAAGLVNDLLAKINASKLNYYTVLAQIEFLTIVKNKMLNLVKSQGDIMNYYFDKKDNRELNISEDLLKYIQFSINNELRSREGSQIDDLIDELTVEAERIRGEEYDAANEKGLKLKQLIDKQIESKKAQLAALNQMIESISARQMDLNSKQDLIDNKRGILKNKKEIIEENYDLALMNDKDYKIEYYYTIAAGIVLLACVGFFGYKLWQRFSKEILSGK